MPDLHEELDANGTAVAFGRVKWFDPARGFGFVVVEGLPRDILLHANVLRNFGQGTVADGALIQIRITRTDRGIQASEVFSIEAPALTTIAIAEGEPALDPAVLQTLPLEPARIKWFDRAKGFGFANVFGNHDDIFLHVDVLRAAGLAGVAPGEAVALRTMVGQRGPMVVQILPWDMAAGTKE